MDNDPKINHIIFDFFGTLVEYTHGHFSGNQYHSTHQFLTNHNFEIEYTNFTSLFSDAFNTREAEAKITNREFHMYDVAKLFFSKNFNAVPDDIIKKFIELYISEWNTNVHFYPGIKKFLKRLKQRYNLIIISNTHYPPLIHSNLDLMGIKDYFNLIVTSVEYGLRKPDPRIFQDTLKKVCRMTMKVRQMPDYAVFLSIKRAHGKD